MNRILSVMLALVCILSLAGCGIIAPSSSPTILEQIEVDVAPPAATPTPEQTDDASPADFTYTYSVTDGKATLIRYTGTDKDVVIPSKAGEYPVEKIGDMAFAYNTEITSVTIPGTITATGKLAFYHCDNLKTVTLGEGITEISYGSFSECASLSDISFPSTVTKIDIGAFKGCLGLDSIDLNGIKQIGEGAFCNSGLKSVVVPASVTSVGQEAFMECQSLESMDWQAKCALREKTFAFCYNLKSVNFAEGVDRIYDSCFRRCESLTSIEFPKSMRRFYNHSLYGCTSLKTITFKGNYVYRFYEMSFHWLPALTDIYFGGNETQWNAATVDANNEALENATIHFGS